MGKVILNIVGYKEPYQIEEDFDKISLKDIYRYLIRKDILLNNLLKCKFVHGGQLLELEKPTIDIKDKINIYLIINDNEFRDIVLKKLFNINIDNELIDNITSEPEEDILNNDLMEYFKDKQFIDLLNIIKEKPEYLQLVNSYLSHGDIINEINYDDICIDNFQYENQFNELNETLKPNLSQWNDVIVKKILTNFEGNVNLTSRYLLV